MTDTSHQSSADDVEGSDLLDRAQRLFQFLKEVQQVRTRSVRHIDTYEFGDGAVVWFGDIPDHSEVSAATVAGDPDLDTPLLTIERVPRLDPPDVPDELAPWLAGETDNPDEAPDLEDTATVPSDSDDPEAPAEVLRLDEHPGIQDTYLQWLDDWEAWADDELDDRPVRELYNELFRIQQLAANSPEEWEVVLGVGAIAWQPEDDEPSLRHLLTQTVELDFDDETGVITLTAGTDTAFTVELDMLDHERWPEASRVHQIREMADQYDQHPLHRDHAGDLARRLIHNIDPNGRYDPADQPSDPGRDAVCTFAPALILRKRTQRGLLDIFDTIGKQLAERGHVPDGIQILLDPDRAPQVPAYDTSRGAWIEDGDDVYLPLPVNNKQRDVISRVDRRALTLVQGPPGTGKTHTASALISHLLAQGKRVLVTAQTDRALKEVRSQLPDEIRDLSVSIVGSGREELAELRTAVNKLSQAASEHDPEEAESDVDEAFERIDKLQTDKARLARRLLEAREAETIEHAHGDYHGTLATIGNEHAKSEERYGWLRPLVDVDPDDEPPLTDTETRELLGLLRDRALHDDEPESQQDLPDIDQLPDPDTYAELTDQATSAREDAATHATLREHDAYATIAGLERDLRGRLRERIDGLADRADELARRHEPWLSDALQAVRAGKAGKWQSRHRQIAELLGRTEPLVDELGPLVDVRLATSNPKPLVPLAEAVLDYVKNGKSIKVDGSTHAPKMGLFTARVIKDAEALFDQVLVDGVPPTTQDALETFLGYERATTQLNALDRAWPTSVEIPSEDSLAEQLAWHETEHRVLAQVIDLGNDLTAVEDWLDELGVPKPDWTSLEDVRRFAQLVDAADTGRALEQAIEPLAEVEELLASAARWDDAAPVVHHLYQAASQRDPSEYRQAHLRLQRLLEVRELTSRRDQLHRQFRDSAPRLARALTDDPDDDRWTDRLRSFEEAWRWCTTAEWIRGRSQENLNALQASYNEVEDRIRAWVTRLAATRAWTKAVGRLGGTQKADLTQYAQLVQKFGKGTSKYAAKMKADMRDAMDRCRPAVPVWIMPLYRIAQSLQVDADIFDVVIVDEASQAGLEATFLQYLAPKMVVIGDDKQVSPSAVGINRAQLHQLANQYLFDDRYKASWSDPQRSLFDEARMRFGDLITLVEHHRCVPDIIGFSNRIAYEPDNIRLVPVRQTGTATLDPIKPVFVENGSYTNKVNRAEGDAIVEQVEKCLVDERYDGMTFGIISLTGEQQAKVIEKKLMDRVDPREWRARELRCGIPPDFQGSERDVMFLSLVAAREEGKRLYPLTRNEYVQRFNVAASRAKDQMWVFHSLKLDELTNNDDMRWQLLDYCYGVASRRERDGEGQLDGPVPEDRLVEPFDSLFEQRVHNRIFDRGYTVIPQYPVHGYQIDLVVVGARGKLAVECDGDRWHGPADYQADMARQRDLQRCGWTFFRVRESEFNIDPAAALEPLWDMLDRRGIHPGGELPDEPAREKTADPDHEPAPIVSDPRVLSEADEETASVEAEETPKDDEVDRTKAVVTEEDGSVERSTGGGFRLKPYGEWDTSISLPDPVEATPRQQRDALLRIAQVEGPVLGSRLYQLYVKSAGGSRVGQRIRRQLNRSTFSLEGKGELAADNPLGEDGQLVKTFRTPDQPSAIPRELGPRDIHEVPPAELAVVLENMWRPNQEEEAWFRAVLDLYGLTRLTSTTQKRLEQCATILNGPHAPDATAEGRP